MTTRSVALVALLLVGTTSVGVAQGAEAREDPRLARATYRCTRLAELIACHDALHMRPDSAALLVAEADVLVQLQRPREAIGVYRNAITVGGNPDMVNARIAVARAQRRALLNGCLRHPGAAAEHACEPAWLPGAAPPAAVPPSAPDAGTPGAAAVSSDGNDAAVTRSN